MTKSQIKRVQKLKTTIRGKYDKSALLRWAKEAEL
jgi:hypothetical protein